MLRFDSILIYKTRRCRVSGGAASPAVARLRAACASQRDHGLRRRLRVRETGYQPVSTPLVVVVVEMF
jgi:hypothetical protein